MQQFHLRRNQILLGDAVERLRELPPATIDCAITSPPYFKLRNYGVTGQLGLEADIAGWVDDLRAVCREVARVLKPGGAFWLNVGDGYSAREQEGAPLKCLLLGPQRLALALAEDGWIIRNQVVWAKSNPMPSSVLDRLSCTYEVLFLLVRSAHYYFDLDAIRVGLRTNRPQTASDPSRVYPPPEARLRGGDGRATNDNSGLSRLKASGRAGHPLGKNPGDVWQFATAGFRGAHFATFPLGLIERPLLATCPVRVCAACGKPWPREPVDRDQVPAALGDLRPGCTCEASTVPGVVLDPFIGSGTVAVAAEQHGRDWVGIELNPAYAAMAEERIRAARAQAPPSDADGAEQLAA
jgi:site-specific DNA-methyltransferase (adenine-specific)